MSYVFDASTTTSAGPSLRRIALRARTDREIAERTDDAQAAALNRLEVRAARDEADLVSLTRQERAVESANRAGADKSKFHSICGGTSSPPHPPYDVARGDPTIPTPLRRLARYRSLGYTRVPVGYLSYPDSSSNTNTPGSPIASSPNPANDSNGRSRSVLITTKSEPSTKRPGTTG